MSILLYAIVGIVALILVSVMLLFNGFVAKRNRVQDAWAQIDVQLKRRYDLIPNLIETVKGYMKYEKNTLTQITQLRSQLISGSVQDKAQANNMISQALKTLFANVENYPNLKASDTMQNLQQELENTENKISFVRTSYNDYVLDYNNAIQQFPGNVFAGMFGFTKKDFFQAPDEAKEPVKVDFSDMGGSQQGPQQQKKPKK
ncbi:MAG: LemA family protein [Candidatus Micrarchaeota archaeon]|nr:LemA family protein [Candidatus Micrarchaeota archaeon]